MLLTYKENPGYKYPYNLLNYYLNPTSYSNMFSYYLGEIKINGLEKFMGLDTNHIYERHIKSEMTDEEKDMDSLARVIAGRPAAGFFHKNFGVLLDHSKFYLSSTEEKDQEMKNELYSLIDKLVRWRMMPERPPINMDISLEDKARWNKFRSSCSFIMNTPVVKDKFINMGRSLDSETGKFYMSDKVLFGLQRVENSKNGFVTKTAFPALRNPGQHDQLFKSVRICKTTQRKFTLQDIITSGQSVNEREMQRNEEAAKKNHFSCEDS